MDVIDKVLLFAETGMQQPIEHGRTSDTEPVEIYKAITRMKTNSAKDFLAWWVSAKEFQRSKLTRSGFIPKGADEETDKLEIEIVHKDLNEKAENENTGDTSI